MLHHLARRPAARAAILLAVGLIAASCGSGGSEADREGDGLPATTTPSQGSTADRPDLDPDGSVDACALLGTEGLADAAALADDAGTWAVAVAPPPGTCEWSNASQDLTLTLDAYAGIDGAIDHLTSGDGVTLANVEVGAAPTIALVDDRSGRYRALYVAAGQDSVLRLGQDPLAIENEQFLAIAQAAAGTLTARGDGA